MSAGDMSETFLVTPGFKCEPSFRAKALRPAAVRPPAGSFSRDFADFLREDFFTVFLSAERLTVARFVGAFFPDLFFAVFFDAICMLSTRLGYGRPARRARAFAAVFLAGDRWLDALPARLRGFGRFHGARCFFSMIINA